MKAQVIEQDGAPAFAVLPYDEYRALLRGLQDWRDGKDAEEILMRIAEGEETYPIEFVHKLVECDSRLREWRKYRAFTQAQLADRAGLTQGAVAAIELGHRSPNVRSARRLADALGCAVDDLF